MSIVPAPSSVDAVEAARAAFRIAASSESSEPIVLRAGEFEHPQCAVTAALDARRLDAHGVTYRDVHVEARYDSHGVVVFLDDADFLEDDGLLSVVVSIRCALELGELAQIGVLSEVRRQIDAAADDTGEFGVYVHEIVHIIHEA